MSKCVRGADLLTNVPEDRKAWIEKRLQDLAQIFAVGVAGFTVRQDKTHGAFFERRFKSVAVLDDEALLAVCAYIDLNPVAAGIVTVPEASPHTSIKTRVEHVHEQGRTSDLAAAAGGSVAGSCASAGLEESLWLCPIEDRRGLDSSREGMLEGFSLGSYLLLVDYTGRLFRDGKATISRELSGIFDRLGSRGKGHALRIPAQMILGQ